MSSLDQYEHSRLLFLEAAAAEIKRIHLHVGRYLKEIKTENLYRNHASFETYVADVWKLDLAFAEQLMKAAELADA